ncbi:ubiquitin-binding protein cue5 [Savitreella phatthalungensis]
MSSMDAMAALREAFPNVEPAVVKAVLHASGGDQLKAIDALLGMSDPAFDIDNTKPLEARRSIDDMARSAQIAADENYARQLVADNSERLARAQHRREEAILRRDATQQSSFFDDELPQIRENLVQGFNETKTKVTNFISSLRTQYGQKFDDSRGESSMLTSSIDTRHVLEHDQQDRHVKSDGRSRSYDRDAEHLDLADPSLTQWTGELQQVDHTQRSKGLPAEPLPANSTTVGLTRGQDNTTADTSGKSIAKTETPKAGKWQPLQPSVRTKTASTEDQFDLGEDD